VRQTSWRLDIGPGETLILTGDGQIGAVPGASESEHCARKMRCDARRHAHLPRPVADSTPRNRTVWPSPSG